jgi:hypothetical protein
MKMNNAFFVAFLMACLGCVDLSSKRAAFDTLLRKKWSGQCVLGHPLRHLSRNGVVLGRPQKNGFAYDRASVTGRKEIREGQKLLSIRDLEGIELATLRLTPEGDVEVWAYTAAVTEGSEPGEGPVGKVLFACQYNEAIAITIDPLHLLRAVQNQSLRFPKGTVISQLSLHEADGKVIREFADYQPANPNIELPAVVYAQRRILNRFNFNAKRTPPDEPALQVLGFPGRFDTYEAKATVTNDIDLNESSLLKYHQPVTLAIEYRDATGVEYSMISFAKVINSKTLRMTLQGMSSNPEVPQGLAFSCDLDAPVH